MKCWADTYCKKKPAGCSEFCEAYVILEALYSMSGMPKIYQFPQKLVIEKSDAASYTAVKAYMDDVVDNVDEGQGLYLYGKQTGTGKTSLACSVANAYLRRRAFYSNLECVVAYLHVPTFMEDYRKSYHDDDKAVEMAHRLSDILKSRLVVWDDIGAEKPSEWVRERLLTLIDKRVGDGLANIFTSNLTIAELSNPEVLGKRLASRIKGCTKQYEFIGSDKR